MIRQNASCHIVSALVRVKYYDASVGLAVRGAVVYAPSSCRGRHYQQRLVLRRPGRAGWKRCAAPDGAAVPCFGPALGYTGLAVANAPRLRSHRAVSFSKSAGDEAYLLYHTLWWHATRFHGLTDAGNSSIQTDMSYNLELTALPVLDARKHCRNIKVQCSAVREPLQRRLEAATLLRDCGLRVSPAACFG